MVVGAGGVGRTREEQGAFDVSDADSATPLIGAKSTIAA